MLLNKKYIHINEIQLIYLNGSYDKILKYVMFYIKKCNAVMGKIIMLKTMHYNTEMSKTTCYYFIFKYK